MDALYTLFLIAHVSAGFTSLGLFFIPAFAKKGGKLHNTVGRWYVYGMWTVIVTALLLCSIRFQQGLYGQAMFLGYLGLLTSRPLYYGIAVLRNKRGPSLPMQRIDSTLSMALAIFGVYLIGAGLNWWGPGGHQLLIIFGALGTIISVPSLVADFRGTQRKYNWLVEHISGMLVSAIAAFTAFFAFGGRRLFGDVFDGNLQIVLWIAPTLIGVVVIKYYKRKVLRKARPVGAGRVI